jgi:chorismate dehydratase
MILGRLGRMAYINTLPVDWGLVTGSLGDAVDIRRGTPTELNRMLAEGSIDVSPVSCVAAAEHADDWLIVDHLCIGCHGAVGSVILHSDRPVEELHAARIAVTKASATAVRLLEVLLSNHWHVRAEFVPQDQPAEARLLIGDSALRTAQSGVAGHVYDLGQAWQDYTGGSFVFGLWCIRKEFVEDHPGKALTIGRLLEASHRMGRTALPDVITEAARTVELPQAIIERYFGQLVHELDDRLWAGLTHFLRLLGHDPARLGVFDVGPQMTPVAVDTLTRSPLRPDVAPFVGQTL